MGNAPSMLTQYDIEEVQEHCNKLCGCYLFVLIYILFRFVVEVEFSDTLVVMILVEFALAEIVEDGGWFEF